MCVSSTQIMKVVRKPKLKYKYQYNFVAKEPALIVIISGKFVAERL